MMDNTRESAAAIFTSDAERVQYDGADADRVKDVAATLTHHAVELIESLGEYAKETQAEVDEDSESRMGYCRRDAIEKWATLQLAISKLALILRVDGEEAYRRLTTALNIEGGNIDMRGL